MTPIATRRRSIAALTLTAALALLAACGTDTTSATPRSATPAQNGVQNIARVTTLDGGKITIPDGKPAALFFFTVGCGECAGGAKSLAQAAQTAQKAGQRASFLAVDLDPSESAQTIAAFQRSIGALNVPAVIDTGAALSQRFSVAAQSTLIVVDPTGQVSYRGTDPSADQITAALRQAGGAR